MKGGLFTNRLFSLEINSHRVEIERHSLRQFY